MKAVFLIACNDNFSCENRFRQAATHLVDKNCAPDWFRSVLYIEWVGEHKDLRFVCDDINRVIIIDDYPPSIKLTQRHRLIQINEYLGPYTHEPPDTNDIELKRVMAILKSFT